MDSIVGIGKKVTLVDPDDGRDDDASSDTTHGSSKRAGDDAVDGKNIAFSLSESSFALFPPIEQGASDLCARRSRTDWQPPSSVLSSADRPPCVAIAAGSPKLKPMYPARNALAPTVVDGDAFPIGPGVGEMPLSRGGIRGDSYAGGVNLLDTDEAQDRLSNLMVAAARNCESTPSERCEHPPQCALYDVAALYTHLASLLMWCASPF